MTDFFTNLSANNDGEIIPSENTGLNIDNIKAQL